MIFSGELFGKVLDGSKTVTRRRSPKRVGALVAVQQKRGLKGVGFVRVKSCELVSDWERKKRDSFLSLSEPLFRDEVLEPEAAREGFDSWSGFEQKIFELYGEDWESIKHLFYRIEFELVK